MLVSGVEDLCTVDETRNSPRIVLLQHLVNEWQRTILPVLVYGYHRFILMLQCLKLLNKARIHQELF